MPVNSSPVTEDAAEAAPVRRPVPTLVYWLIVPAIGAIWSVWQVQWTAALLPLLALTLAFLLWRTFRPGATWNSPLLRVTLGVGIVAVLAAGGIANLGRLVSGRPWVGIPAGTYTIAGTVVQLQHPVTATAFDLIHQQPSVTDLNSIGLLALPAYLGLPGPMVLLAVALAGSAWGQRSERIIPQGIALIVLCYALSGFGAARAAAVSVSVTAGSGFQPQILTGGLNLLEGSAIIALLPVGLGLYFTYASLRAQGKPVLGQLQTWFTLVTGAAKSFLQEHAEKNADASKHTT